MSKPFKKTQNLEGSWLYFDFIRHVIDSSSKVTTFIDFDHAVLEAKIEIKEKLKVVIVVLRLLFGVFKQQFLLVGGT